MSIQAEIQGGLGNQLFIVSALLGESKRQNIPYLIKKTISYSVTPRNTFWDIILHKLKYVEELPKHDIIYTEKNNDIHSPIINANGKHLKINGYFQCSKYFSGDEKELFCLKEEHQSIVDKQFEDLKKDFPKDIKVNFIHVRRGDYLKYANVFYIMEMEWYKRALQHFNEDDLFLIFSDDIEWCRQNFSFLKHKQYVSNVDYIDLFLMSKCDGAIIPNSTFSWWGAYLGKEKKVVCPDIWMKNNISQRDMRNESSWINLPIFLKEDIVSKTIEEIKESKEIKPISSILKSTTLITGYFRLPGVNRPTHFDEYIELSKKLLNFDHNMVIFVDYETYDLIWKIRKEFNLLHKTFFIPMSLTNFSLYYLKPKLDINHQKNPSVKHTPDYSILTISKLEMLDKVSKINPFSSTHFTWVDFGIAKFNNYASHHQLRILMNTFKDKFSLTQLNFVSKQLIQPGQPYHKDKGFAVAAGCMSGNSFHLSKIWELTKIYYEKAVNEGYLVVEENILKELFVDYPDLFDVYYGTYSAVIMNYSRIRIHAENIIGNTCIPARINKDYNTGFKVCDQIYRSWINDIVTIEREYILKLLDEYFISSWWTNNKNICVEIVKKLEHLLNDENIVREFKKKQDHYTGNFDFVFSLLPTTKNIYCLEKPNDEELNVLMLEGKVHIYSCEDYISSNYMLTANPIIRSHMRMKSVKFDQNYVKWNFNFKNTFYIMPNNLEDRLVSSETSEKKLVSSETSEKKLIAKFKLQNLTCSCLNSATIDDIIDNFDPKMSVVEQMYMQSHFNLWKYQVKNKIPYALILEGGISFDNEWRKKLDTIASSIDYNWNIIILNSFEKSDKPFTWERIFVKQKSEDLNPERISVSQKSEDLNPERNLNPDFIPSAYILSYKGAKSLIDKYNSEKCFYTTNFISLQKDNGYTYSPGLILQDLHDVEVEKVLSEMNYSLQNYEIQENLQEDLQDVSQNKFPMLDMTDIIPFRFHFTEENTFCISLESSTVRWQKMERRFKNQNLNVTRWIASTPDNLTDIFREHLKPTEKACAQSHINIWKHQIKNNLPYVFIMEDDICFDKKWREKLNEFSNVIKDREWDMVMLNAAGKNDSVNKWEIKYEQYYCGGYILSLSGAKELINMFQDNFNVADKMTIELQYRERTYVYFPWLQIQENSDSTIGNNISQEYKYVTTRLGEISYSLDNYDI